MLKEKRFTEFETNINTILKSMEGKDNKIAMLEISIREVQETVEKVYRSNELQKKTTLKQKFNCDFCDFQTTSMKGLKTHITRKHTKISEGVTSIACDLCNNDFENENELKEHMITHSYIEASELKFKCDECDFWGPNHHSMRMHFRRLHCKTISCGMCNLEAPDLETLDNHTFTCEMFKCCDCKLVFYTFSDMKEHTTKEHKTWGTLRHYNCWRRNESFYNDSFHRSRDLFEIQKR